MLKVSSPLPTDVCVDLGDGTGFVTTVLAPLVSSVLAVDLSEAMARSLAERAAYAGLANVSTKVADLKDFQLPPASADLIFSSCALHHLDQPAIPALVSPELQWRGPGGRLV